MTDDTKDEYEDTRKAIQRLIAAHFDLPDLHLRFQEELFMLALDWRKQQFDACLRIAETVRIEAETQPDAYPTGKDAAWEIWHRFFEET